MKGHRDGSNSTEGSGSDRDHTVIGTRPTRSWEHAASSVTTSAKSKHGSHPPPSSSSRSFLLQVTGRIESAEICGANDVYCKYNLAMGGDWALASVKY